MQNDPARTKVQVGSLIWSGSQNAYRTFWLDSQGWGSERVLAFVAASTSPEPSLSLGHLHRAP
jgi:hypothetical protein